jgi:Mrp family chromosome partitioning ATPase
MTRIFDALKKAETGRPRLGALPGGEPAWGRVEVPAPLPLAGGLELGQEEMREANALRVNLETALPDRALRAVLFVSAQAGEGTSTVALQFAQAVVANGARALFVDLHARRPVCFADASQQFAVIDAHLGPQAGAGATTAGLAAIPATEEAVRTGMVNPMTVRAIAEAAVGSYDWVVFDGPPVNEAPDAAPISAQVDGVVLVVQAGRSKRPIAMRAVETIRKAGGNLLGTVLNRRVLEIPGFIYRRI